MSDAETVYTSVRDSCNDSEVVVHQNVHRIGSSDSLFYTTVDMGGTVKIGGTLDSGSMACSISETAEVILREAGVITDQKLIGLTRSPPHPTRTTFTSKCAYDAEMEVDGCEMLVPTLVVPGQHDELIVWTNVIKHILHQSKLCESYWKTVSRPCPSGDPETEQFLSMFCSLNQHTWMLLSTQRFPLLAALNQPCRLLQTQILQQTNSGQLGSVVLTWSHVKCQRTTRGKWLTLFCSMRMSSHTTILTVGRQRALYTAYTSDSRPFKLLYSAPWPVLE